MTYVLLGADGKPYRSDVKGQWGGHSGTKIYGRLDCSSALGAIARGGYARHRVFFADEVTAIAVGYRPCGTCCKDRYQAWKATRSRDCVVVAACATEESLINPATDGLVQRVVV
jgi:methylphosphotriester-DNA--protein-cysteine methyltransferase